jgi:hypothetical protein
VKVKASSIGSTTVSLRLLAPDGQPLPGAPVNMTVQSTQLGTVTLVVLAAALAVFMIASASRAIRRGRASGGGSAAAEPDGPDRGGPSAARPAEGSEPGRADGPGGRVGDGSGPPPDGDHEADHAAGHAVTGQASRVSGAGPARAAGRGGHEQPQETDNVGHDRAAPGTAGIDLAATEDADDYARVPGWADRR